MFKKILFQLHWFFGITAGLVLAIMGVTGGLYSFQGEILEVLNPQVLQVEAAGRERLPLAQMIERVEQATGQKVMGLDLSEAPNDVARANLMPAPGERRGKSLLFDPYSGQLLGEPVGSGFFMLVFQLHRWLAMGDVGKQLTGASTLALLFFCLSGLYLRWPRRVLSWRAWLTLDWAKRGRAFHWDLHAVVGTWTLLFYLCAGLTGLYWSYDWYREGATRLLGEGVGELRREGGRPGRDAPAGPPPSVNYDAIWQSLQQAAGPGLAAWNLRLPPVVGQPATLFYLLEDAEHPRALNQLTLDAATGEVKRHQRYAEKPLGSQLLSSVYALHTGEYFGLPGRTLMALASATMPLFAITGWLLYLDRRRKKKAVRAARVGLAPGAVGEPWLIGFASQSGFAERLAWQDAGQLQAAGLVVEVQPLSRLDRERLGAARQALFVVSTFGDGEAPDEARAFERRLLGSELGLEGLRYAVLALGDSQYRQFCGFARRLRDWLDARGASRLFAPVEVDNGDPGALARWRQALAELTGQAAPVPEEQQAFGDWTLLGRECLNPGSQGEPTWRVRLAPVAGADWQAGDILEILPGNDERQAPRDYSIASLPADGALELIVRRQRRADGSPGLASAWLTEQAPPGLRLRARVRRNAGFHLAEPTRPLILIGNGSGLAGLRSLLKASIAAGQVRRWLLFGERNRAHDFYCRDELEAWLAGGQLERLDLAFSRDQAERRYVQDVLRDSAEELRHWVEQGAFLYVCGSLQGMAKGVDDMLRELLGSEQLQALAASGRYRRDVY